jgi:hypothetical protein
MKDSQHENIEKNRVRALLKMALDNTISRMALGAIAGAGIGGLYWEFIGCNGGSCPLTSSPAKTIAIFAIMGTWFNYRKR